GVGIELAMTVGGGYVHRPMARATDRGGAALLEGLVSADLIAQVVPLTFFRDQLVAKLVVEAFGREVAFGFGHPLLQAHVRRNDEFCHSGYLYHMLWKDAEDSVHQTAGRERGAALRAGRWVGDLAKQERDAAFFALHDVTHFAVESTLGFRRGFYGLIIEGWDVEDTTGKGARGPLPKEAV